MKRIVREPMARPGKSRFRASLLLLVILLPVLTGFDYRTADPAPVPGPDRVPSAASGGVATEPLQPAPHSRKDSLTWRRDSGVKPLLVAAAQASPGSAESGKEPGKVLSWETGAGKSYLIPALEVPAFLALLNIRNRFTYEGGGDYNSNLSTTWEHLKRQNWTIDTDPFNTNQFGHPYQGGIMFGMARSTGLGFWESALYSNAGSFLWETAGETPPPSFNDLLTTGTSGSLLGEALFRMSALVLKHGGDKPDLWHELGAALVSPPTGLNRLAFGERFKPVFPSYAPATFWRVRLGAALGGASEQAAATDFAISYGLPGKPGYSYRRPMDYFDFEVAGLSRTESAVEAVLLRGLLYGKDYEAGENYRGIWGLYGSYDYISPGDFRVSNTALSLGSTAQYWLAQGVALQGTLMGGVGFGAAGVTPEEAGSGRDYHYGMTPQVTLALRLLLGDRAVLETVGRGYVVTGTGSDNSSGSERIGRAVANLNVRVIGKHGLGLQLVKSVRDAHYGSLPSKHQSDDTLSLVYTFTGDPHFGAVHWHDPGLR